MSFFRNAACVIALVGVVPLTTFGVTLTPTVTNLSKPVGVAHYQPTNNLISSVNYSNGKPHNLEKILSDGSHTKFSDASGFTGEIRVAAVRDILGGFTLGDLFISTGTVGEIVRVSADGVTIENPWVTLPGETGLVRGLCFDRTGIFGGDLIVGTHRGNIWRVTAAGVPTKVGSIGPNPNPSLPFIEGLAIVPDDSAKYGPWAGKILIGAESVSRIYAIDPQGNVDKPYDLGIEEPEDIAIVPANENFFGIDHTANILYGAPSSEFVGMVGDILISQEENPGNLFSVHWDGKSASFQVTKVAEVTQWEQMTFSTAGVTTIPEVIVSGCINRNGLPVKGRNVVLKEKGETNKIIKSDINGNYLFDKNNVVPGKYFQILINGPRFKKVSKISGCINLKGAPLAGRKVTLKQKGEVNKIAFTDSNGRYQFSGAVPGKAFQVVISGPKIK